jgi:hypothetical protein
MKTLLDSSKGPEVPPIIRLHCIHCALRTLSGPGEEIGVDNEVFVNGLRVLAKDFPNSIEFDRWDIFLECVEYCVIKKREEKPNVVLDLVQMLFVCIGHLNCGTGIGATALTLLHRFVSTKISLTILLTNKLTD